MGKEGKMNGKGEKVLGKEKTGIERIKKGWDRKRRSDGKVEVMGKE